MEYGNIICHWCGDACEDDELSIIGIDGEPDYFCSWECMEEFIESVGDDPDLYK